MCHRRRISPNIPFTIKPIAHSAYSHQQWGKLVCAEGAWHSHDHLVPNYITKKCMLMLLLQQCITIFDYLNHKLHCWRHIFVIFCFLIAQESLFLSYWTKERRWYKIYIYIVIMRYSFMKVNYRT